MATARECCVVGSVCSRGVPLALERTPSLYLLLLPNRQNLAELAMREVV